MGLVHGDADGIPIGRAGRGKDEFLTAMPLHGLDQNEGGGEVIAVVLERVLDGLADECVGGEMEDGLGLVLGKDALDECSITHLSFYKSDAIQRQGLGMAKDEIIKHDDLFPGGEKMLNRMGADVAGTAGYEE
jgi:hypothetical protein